MELTSANFLGKTFEILQFHHAGVSPASWKSSKWKKESPVLEALLPDVTSLCCFPAVLPGTCLVGCSSWGRAVTALGWPQTGLKKVHSVKEHFYFCLTWASAGVQSTCLTHRSVKLCQRCVGLLWWLEYLDTGNVEAKRSRNTQLLFGDPFSGCLSKTCTSFTVV